jgi:hypothetical protein
VFVVSTRVCCSFSRIRVSTISTFFYFHGFCSGTIIDDIDDNPYYMGNTESLNLSLVNRKLNGDNYASWSRAARKALNAKNKFGLIDGSIVLPSKTTDKKNITYGCR